MAPRPQKHTGSALVLVSLVTFAVRTGALSTGGPLGRPMWPLGTGTNAPGFGRVEGATVPTTSAVPPPAAQVPFPTPDATSSATPDVGPALPGVEVNLRDVSSSNLALYHDIISTLKNSLHNAQPIAVSVGVYCRGCSPN